MTITDTFNRADSATSLGTTSDGSATWVAAVGTWGINTNQAYQTVLDGNDKLAYIDTGASDGTLRVSAPTPGAASGSGLTIRYVDTSNWYAIRYNSAGTAKLVRKLTGTVAALASFTFTVGHVLRADMSGSTIKIYDDTSSTLLVTDTSGSFTTATKHGLYASPSDNTQRLDDWSFTPPAAPPAFTLPHIAVRSRAVSRAAVI